MRKSPSQNIQQLQQQPTFLRPRKHGIGRETVVASYISHLCFLGVIIRSTHYTRPSREGMYSVLSYDYLVPSNLASKR